MGNVLRCGRFSRRRGGSWASVTFAGAAALSTVLLAVPGPAQAGIAGGGGTSEYIVSAPSGTETAALNAVTGVGAQVGSSLSFVDAVTSELSQSQVSLLQAIPGIVVT